jgi:hypothetical protein
MLNISAAEAATRTHLHPGNRSRRNKRHYMFSVLSEQIRASDFPPHSTYGRSGFW